MLQRYRCDPYIVNVDGKLAQMLLGLILPLAGGCVRQIRSMIIA